MMKLLRSIPALLILVMLLAGCSSSGREEQPDEPSIGPSIVLRSRALDDRNATDQERINSWWMAFVHDGTVAKIIDRSHSKDLSGNPLPTTAVEEEEFKAEINPGTYTIYAFANMGDYSAAGDHFGLEPGKPVPADFEASIWSSKLEIGDLVPMTGVVRDVYLPPLSSQAVVVEVVRLYGKVRFELQSDAVMARKIARVTMRDAYADRVSLLPDYSILGDDGKRSSAPTVPADATPGAAVLNGGNQPLPHSSASKPVILEGYVLETASTHPTGRYLIEFDFLDADNKSHQTSALAFDLTHITRNDLIIIPVTFTDWIINLSLDFYPPIGGYPMAELTDKGEEYYAEFVSSGSFEISTAIEVAASGVKLRPEQYDISVAVVNAPAGFFTEEPTYDSVNHELTGEIGAVTGTAELKLTFTIQEDALHHIFTRKLFIIRKSK